MPTPAQDQRHTVTTDELGPVARVGDLLLAKAAEKRLMLVRLDELLAMKTAIPRCSADAAVRHFQSDQKIFRPRCQVSRPGRDSIPATLSRESPRRTRGDEDVASPNQDSDPRANPGSRPSCADPKGRRTEELHPKGEVPDVHPTIECGITPPGLRARRRLVSRPSLEGMESRLLLSASTYTVDSVGDLDHPDSPTSGDLRYCVNQANSNPGSTIVFSPDIDDSIFLNQPLILSANVAIMGPSASGITLDGGGTTEILDVEPGVTASLSGLTINAGYAPDGLAAGIENDGNLTVTDTTVSNNDGNAVYNTGTITLGATISRITAVASAPF